MKELQRDLQSVLKSLRALTQKTEKMIKRLEELEKSQAPKRPKVKPKAVKKAVAKKPAEMSANETVLAIIKRSRKGVDKAALVKKTGFEGRKIWDIIYSLKKQGKIKSERKGLYVKA
jgi:predicted Rossmann fold nucleotide-binding protein DprA/Smf involved in DNA uptake